MPVCRQRNQKGADVKERRAVNRRDLISKEAYTVVGKKGQVFNADRRRIPDRRLNNIRVEFISIDDFYLSNGDSVYRS